MVGCPLCAKNGHHALQQNQSLSITSGEYAPLRRLFVVRDATALNADARLKGLLDGGFTCLWRTLLIRALPDKRSASSDDGRA